MSFVNKIKREIRIVFIFNIYSLLLKIEVQSYRTCFIGPGIHMPGKIELHSGDRVYVDKDALVYGWIFAENQENIEIYGNGIFDGSGEGRFSIHCYENYTNGNFKMYDCKNIKVNGVGFRDSAIWCLNIFHCENISFDRVNVFGQFSCCYYLCAFIDKL